MIAQINRRHDRLILQADLKYLSESSQFAEYFAEVSWGNATALERLITLLLLDHPTTSQSEMATLLQQRALKITAEQLDRAFNGLELYSILHREGTQYAFAAPNFPAVLRRSQDIHGLIQSYSQEIQRTNGRLL